ncbi:MAG: hypothetical protein JW726_02360 [Anaerolineales bacterium]|nr:hypothetical protein [Anaerolineales bacterium]
MRRAYPLFAMLILLSLACSNLPAVSPPPTIQPTPAVPVTEEAPAELPAEPSQTAPPAPTPQPEPTLAEAVTEGHPIQPSSLPGEWLLFDSPNAVRVLLFDGQYLWAGSGGGGLVQWEPATQNATRHTRASGFPLRTVYDLAFDAATGFVYAVGDAGLAILKDGQWQHSPCAQLGFEADLPLSAVAVEPGTTTIWVGGQEAVTYADDLSEPTTRGGGLLRLDWQSGAWERFTAPDPLLSNQVNDLLIDANGTLWVAGGQYGNEPTAGGISFRDAAGNWGEFGRDHGSDGYTNDRGLNGYAFGQLALGAGGRIYAANRRGVSWLDAGAEKWQFVEFWDVQQMAVDAQGALWAAAREGLFRLEDGALSNVYRQESGEGGEYDYLRAVALDGQGAVWFGGEQGLQIWEDGSVMGLAVPGALPALAVSDVALKGDGTLWLRSGGAVCQLVAEATIQCYENERLAIEAAYPWAGSEPLWPMAPDGSLWLLEERTLWGYDQNGWRSVPMDASIGQAVQGFTVAAEGLLALASENGLALYDPTQGWHMVPSYTPPPAYFAFYNPFYDPASHAIWGAAAYSAFYAGQAVRFSLDSQSWEKVAEEVLGGIPPQGLSISPSGEVYAVTTQGQAFVLREGSWQALPLTAEAMGSTGFAWLKFGLGADLWLATLDPCGFEALCVSGLVYFDTANWMRWTPQNSNLASAWVLDVVTTPDDKVWVATAGGLQKFAPP